MTESHKRAGNCFLSLILFFFIILIFRKQKCHRKAKIPRAGAGNSGFVRCCGFSIFSSITHGAAAVVGGGMGGLGVTFISYSHSRQTYIFIKVHKEFPPSILATAWLSLSRQDLPVLFPWTRICPRFPSPDERLEELFFRWKKLSQPPDPCWDAAGMGQLRFMSPHMLWCAACHPFFPRIFYFSLSQQT